MDKIFEEIAKQKEEFIRHYEFVPNILLADIDSEFVLLDHIYSCHSKILSGGKLSSKEMATYINIDHILEGMKIVPCSCLNLKERIGKEIAVMLMKK